MIDYLEEGKLYSFKLNSGEEVFGRVKKIDKDTNAIGLERAISIGMTHEGPKPVPSMMTVVPDIEMWLNASSCAMIAPTAPDMEDVYRQVTTGLTTPPKQIITG